MKQLFEFPLDLVPENYDTLPARGTEGARMALLGDSVLSLQARRRALTMSSLWTAGEIHTVSSHWTTNRTIAEVILNSNIWMAVGLPPFYMVRWSENQHVGNELSDRVVATGFEAMLGQIFQSSPKSAYALADKFLEFASTIPVSDSIDGGAEEALDISRAEGGDNVREGVGYEAPIAGNANEPFSAEAEHEGVRIILDTPCLVGCVEEVIADESSEGSPDDRKFDDIIQVPCAPDRSDGCQANHDASEDGVSSTGGTSHSSTPPPTLESGGLVEPLEARPFRPVSFGARFAGESSSRLELNASSPFAKLAAEVQQSLAMIDVIEEHPDTTSSSLVDLEE